MSISNINCSTATIKLILPDIWSKQSKQSVWSKQSVYTVCYWGSTRAARAIAWYTNEIGECFYPGADPELEKILYAVCRAHDDLFIDH